MRGTRTAVLCILLAAVLLVPLSTGGYRAAFTERESRAYTDPDDGDVCTLLDTPQVEDRLRDVKIFGLLPVFPQWSLRHVDIVSTAFDEDGDTPDTLILSMELRDLLPSTVVFEAVYSVSWTYNNMHYGTVVHVRPDGVHSFLVGRSTDGDDDIEHWETCEGTLDADADLLTWHVPKTAIGDPPQGGRLENIHPHTHLRPTGDAWMPPVDLFKDLSHNARSIADYTVKY